MADLTLQRIPFNSGADTQMRTLKARTGITPNYFCRLGFCLSLDEPGIPEASGKSDESGREINRFTLLGEYDVAYVSLLKHYSSLRHHHFFTKSLPLFSKSLLSLSLSLPINHYLRY